MEEKQEKKFSRKQTIIASLFALFLISGVVFAAYTVLTTSMTLTVEEAFENYYAIPESTSVECSSIADADYQLLPEEGIDLGQLYPGEQKKVCFKIHNKSSAQLAYNILVTTDSEDLLVETTINPPVAGNGDSYSHSLVVVQDYAKPQEYSIDVEITRGAE